ncbi:phage antirepressor N-terminal domain-containing protein [Glycomyces sp. A-F 0318]|uniref:phage antirepressor N-terminal domain-containing protein n=1 Tax=Glycomyces amatae TaxID=2881355 RepID=UPI001E606C5E|nr:phage antirepressor N-terminal domain-containing protein [Glycomyces amatae]
MPFHGRVIHTTLGIDGEPAIVLKPTIEAMGLDYSTQLRKLKSRSWAVMGETPTTGTDGKTYMMVTIDLETWSMLLANIDENKVSLAARSLVIAYQRESAKALRDYWTQGIAINPRVSVEQAAKVIAVFAQAGIGDAGFWDTKARQLTGRVLGESPEYDERIKPLTVSIYLDGLNLKSAEVKKVRGVFGKRLKAKYIDVYGTNPPQIEDLVDRHMVKVAQYQEQHRPLFDDVWRSLNRNEGGASRPRNRRN